MTTHPPPAHRTLSAIVLAAGEGTRMRSTRPKPLHLLCGRAMVLYVLDSLSGLPLDRAVVVVGHGAERVTKKLSDSAADLPLEFVEQHVQRGTGDAVAVALTTFPDDDVDDGGDVLVLPGDTPLLRRATIEALVEQHRASGVACTVLTAVVADPTGYGRVVRGRDGRVERIVEHDDADDEERAITEINTSIYCFRRSLLAPALRRIDPDNAQGEYYLTDVVEVLADAGHPVGAVVVRRRARDRRGQRPRAARGGRGRAAAPHQRGVAAGRRHDGRPDDHLRRRHGAPRARRHAVPRGRAPGEHERRRGHRDRARLRLVDCIVGARAALESHRRP